MTHQHLATAILRRTFLAGVAGTAAALLCPVPSFAAAKVIRISTPGSAEDSPALRVAENVGMRPVASEEDDDVGEVLLYTVTAPASVGSA